MTLHLITTEEIRKVLLEEFIEYKRTHGEPSRIRVLRHLVKVRPYVRTVLPHPNWKVT